MCTSSITLIVNQHQVPLANSYCPRTWWIYEMIDRIILFASVFFTSILIHGEKYSKYNIGEHSLKMEAGYLEIAGYILLGHYSKGKMALQSAYETDQAQVVNTLTEANIKLDFETYISLFKKGKELAPSILQLLINHVASSNKVDLTKALLDKYPELPLEISCEELDTYSCKIICLILEKLHKSGHHTVITEMLITSLKENLSRLRDMILLRVEDEKIKISLTYEHVSFPLPCGSLVLDKLSHFTLIFCLKENEAKEILKKAFDQGNAKCIRSLKQAGPLRKAEFFSLILKNVAHSENVSFVEQLISNGTLPSKWEIPFHFRFKFFSSIRLKMMKFLVEKKILIMNEDEVKCTFFHSDPQVFEYALKQIHHGQEIVNSFFQTRWKGTRLILSLRDGPDNKREIRLLNLGADLEKNLFYNWKYLSDDSQWKSYKDELYKAVTPIQKIMGKEHQTLQPHFLICHGIYRKNTDLMVAIAQNSTSQKLNLLDQHLLFDYLVTQGKIEIVKNSLQLKTPFLRFQDSFPLAHNLQKKHKFWRDLCPQLEKIKTHFEDVLKGFLELGEPPPKVITQSISNFTTFPRALQGRGVLDLNGS